MIKVTREQISADVANVVNTWFPKQPDQVSGVDVFKLRGALIAVLTDVGNMIEYSALRDFHLMHAFDENGDPPARRYADAWPELNRPAIEGE